MKNRLVRLDDVSWRHTEIDTIKMKHTAMSLRSMFYTTIRGDYLESPKTEWRAGKRYVQVEFEEDERRRLHSVCKFLKARLKRFWSNDAEASTEVIRRLVLLDESSHFTEIDPVKLRRVALKFREWLMKLKANADSAKFFQLDLSLVESVLNGTLVLPCKGPDHHNWEIRECLISRAYMSASSPFYNTIRGERLTPPEIIEQGDRRYAWMHFERPLNELKRSNKSSTFGRRPFNVCNAIE